jgi:hypothetical protein
MAPSYELGDRASQASAVETTQTGDTLTGNNCVPPVSRLSHSLENAESETERHMTVAALSGPPAQELAPLSRRPAQHRRSSKEESAHGARPAEAQRVRSQDGESRLEAIPLSTVDLRHDFRKSGSLVPPAGGHWMERVRTSQHDGDDRRASVRSTASAASSLGPCGSTTPTGHEPFGMEGKPVRPLSSASAASSGGSSGTLSGNADGRRQVRSFIA